MANLNTPVDITVFLDEQGYSVITETVSLSSKMKMDSISLLRLMIPRLSLW